MKETNIASVNNFWIMNALRGGRRMSANIYYSLESVLASLTEYRECTEVQQLFHICKQDGLLVETNGNYLPRKTNHKNKDESSPFVVIEGLDGTGKTSLAAKIQEKYHMCALQTPPKIISHFREFFDHQPEPVRRAFYSLGNYLAANNVSKCKEAVIMDRFWHSTAAYALGKTKTEEDIGNINLDWPNDLLEPNVVLFLFVSEAERIRRHATRHLQTNTLEEQTLAKDQAFRDNIVDIYRNIKGPTFFEINADVSIAEVENHVFEILENKFPALSR